MIIIIPSEYQIYLKMLVSCNYGKNEMDVGIRLFEEGLDNVLNDFAMGADKPDMDIELQDYLKEFEEKINIEIPDDLKSIEKIQPISKAWNYTIERTKTVIFAFGLGNDGYAFMRYSCEKYKKDSEFRNLVDNMPHERGLESKREILQELDNENDLY